MHMVNTRGQWPMEANLGIGPLNISFLSELLQGHLLHVLEQWSVHLCERVDILDVPLWQYQQVLPSYGSYVPEDGNMGILVAQRLAICDYLTELALLEHFIVVGTTLELDFSIKLVLRERLDRPSGHPNGEHECQDEKCLFALILRQFKPKLV